MNNSIKTDINIRLLKVARQHSESVINQLFNTIGLLNNAINIHNAKAPYYINLIEELHVDENANSRILAKLLQFKDESGKFEILQSFFNYIKDSQLIEQFNLRIKNPVITQEKERIDIWIRDEGYAIIIENKINGAIDQDAQIANYIIKTIKGDINYKPEQIFVIYMPSYSYEPDEKSWGHDKKLKKTFASRFGIVSFSENILPWLQTKVLPNIRHKDKNLYCAVEQYIYYLEGLFGLRKHQNQLNMELKEIIAKQLELESISSINERIDKLETACRDMDDLRNQIVNMILEEKRNYFPEKWNNEFVLPSSNLFKINRDATGQRLGFGVTFLIDEKPTELFIGYDGKLYCQIEFSNHLSSDKRNINNATWFPVIKELLPKTDNKSCQWEYFLPYQFDAVYERFKSVVKTLDENLSSNL